jgi:hypothetical protein
MVPFKKDLRINAPETIPYYWNEGTPPHTFYEAHDYTGTQN